MSENVSKSSLYDIVGGKKSSNKRRVGYTVSAYSGVLSALKRIDEMDGSGSQSILGKNKIDWKKYKLHSMTQLQDLLLVLVEKVLCGKWV